jgi:hypothetical protein
MELPPVEGGDDGVAGRLSLRDIPTTTLHITQLSDRMPDRERHTAPRRQLVVVLRGELEITTTEGDQQRFRTGDCLLADDLDTQGHITRDVGDEPLITLAIGIVPEWRCPDT